MPTKDTDCKSHSSHIEDNAGDEEGEETEADLGSVRLLKEFKVLVDSEENEEDIEQSRGDWKGETERLLN